MPGYGGESHAFCIRALFTRVFCAQNKPILGHLSEFPVLWRELIVSKLKSVPRSLWCCKSVQHTRGELAFIRSTPDFVSWTCAELVLNLWLQWKNPSLSLFPVREFQSCIRNQRAETLAMKWAQKPKIYKHTPLSITPQHNAIMRGVKSFGGIKGKNLKFPRGAIEFSLSSRLWGYWVI